MRLAGVSMSAVTEVNALGSGSCGFIRRPVSSDQEPAESSVAFPSNSGIKSQRWQHYFMNGNDKNKELVLWDARPSARKLVCLHLSPLASFYKNVLQEEPSQGQSYVVNEYKGNTFALLRFLSKPWQSVCSMHLLIASLLTILGVFGLKKKNVTQTLPSSNTAFSCSVWNPPPPSFLFL